MCKAKLSSLSSVHKHTCIANKMPRVDGRWVWEGLGMAIKYWLLYLSLFCNVELYTLVSDMHHHIISSPILPPKENIFDKLSSINTSPIEVAKLCRDIIKSNLSHCGVPG